MSVHPSKVLATRKIMYRCTIDEVNRRLWNLGWSALEEVCEWFLRRGHLELQLHKEYKNRGSQSGVWGCPGLVL